MRRGPTRRGPLSGADLCVYIGALPLLVRNPAIVVVPLLTLVVGVLLNLVLAPSAGGAAGGLTLGLAQLVAVLLGLYGLGSACILADGAWRRGRMPFDSAWTETQRRSGDLLAAAVAFSLLVFVAQYAGQLLGSVGGLILQAVAVFFLIWTIPAAAVGGIPGSGAIQVSVERVRANPLVAALVTIVSLAVVFYLPLLLTGLVGGLLGPTTSGIVDQPDLRALPRDRDRLRRAGAHHARTPTPRSPVRPGCSAREPAVDQAARDRLEVRRARVQPRRARPARRPGRTSAPRPAPRRPAASGRAPRGRSSPASASAGTARARSPRSAPCPAARARRSPRAPRARPPLRPSRRARRSRPGSSTCPPARRPGGPAGRARRRGRAR